MPTPIQCSKKDILTLIAQHIPSDPIIVEAGAFDGSDTKRLSNAWPQGTIHAFEPVPAIFQKLTQTARNLPNVMTHPYALGERDGTAELYVAVKPSAPDTPHQASSLLKPKERLTRSPLTYPHTIEVTTITLDSWAHQQKVDHIDFLWLDVQGYAFNILKSSPGMLKKLTALYVEVEFIEAYENQQQYPALKLWLEGQGFALIARDFSDQPTWFYGNALFIRT